MNRLVYTVLLLAIGGTAMSIPADAATLSPPTHPPIPQPVSPAEHVATKHPVHSAIKNKIKIGEEILHGKSPRIHLSTAKAGGSSRTTSAPAEASDTNSATDTPLLHPRPVLDWRSLLPGSIQ